jgi:hypothetical protein
MSRAVTGLALADSVELSPSVDSREPNSGNATRDAGQHVGQALEELSSTPRGSRWALPNHLSRHAHLGKGPVPVGTCPFPAPCIQLDFHWARRYVKYSTAPNTCQENSFTLHAVPAANGVAGDRSSTDGVGRRGRRPRIRSAPRRDKRSPRRIAMQRHRETPWHRRVEMSATRCGVIVSQRDGRESRAVRFAIPFAPLRVATAAIVLATSSAFQRLRFP